jgi:hypothetical protein
VDEFDKMKGTHDALSMMEYTGEVVPEEECSLHRDPVRDSFMYCTGADGDYFYEPRSGRIVPWQTWKESLYIVCGVDFASSLSADADFSAGIVVGIDAAGVCYALDAYIRRVQPEKLLDMVLITLNRQWSLDLVCPEAASNQKIVVRFWELFARKLEAEGQRMPRREPVKQDTTLKKSARVIGTLQARLHADQLRFMRLEPCTDVDGMVHTPARRERANDYRVLLDQVDGYTARGATGPDDGIDAMEMAVRAAWKMRPRSAEADETATEILLRDAGDLGIDVPMGVLPPAMWTKEMRERANNPVQYAMRQGIIIEEEFDPYD